MWNFAHRESDSKAGHSKDNDKKFTSTETAKCSGSGETEKHTEEEQEAKISTKQNYRYKVDKNNSPKQKGGVELVRVGRREKDRETERQTNTARIGVNQRKAPNMSQSNKNKREADSPRNSTPKRTGVNVSKKSII